MTSQTDGATCAKKRLHPLTSLRFFAAALIVFYHCGNTAFETSPPWFRCLLQNGYQAVTFFFVLSGFILVYTYCQGDRQDVSRRMPVRFWIARFARIYPSYLLALAISLPALIYYAFFKNTISQASFAATLVFVPVLLQAWLPPVAGAWNGPAWALSVEACFYLCFPALTRALKSKSPLCLLCSSMALVAAVQLIRLFIFPLPEWDLRPNDPSSLHSFFAYFPLFHLPTFIFGMALGRVLLSLPTGYRLPFRNILQLSSLCLLLGLFFNHGRIAPVLLSDIVMAPLFGAIVLSSAIEGGLLNRLLSHSFLVELGQTSYAMYIFHIPLMWWATRLRGLVPLFDGKNDLAFFWCYFAALIFICTLVFRYYEEPVRKWILVHTTAKLTNGGHLILAASDFSRGALKDNSTAI
ncbi:MAG: acyltransferase [Syntrophobacteraceae bacterium]|jgi:peptidoglycan/LPS O-acetylase OafA/YrhL